MWRLWALLALASLTIALVASFGLPGLLALLALPLAAADKIAGVLGADEQVAEPGRPRRGGLGGGDSAEAESTEALDPSGSENPNSGRPRQRSRPRRSGF